MKVSGEWIARAATQVVCSILEDAGHKALFVGGCVRNALLGMPVADVDLATDAKPERVAELVTAAGLRAVDTGMAHGTVTVVSDGTGYEVTTFRRDIETFGRHAVVAYSDRVEDDAARRDFTMNALYATPDGTVMDPLGGLADLTARRVRFVGIPEQRIREDYLRILRFFRFHAWYGDAAAGLDREGLAACAAHAEGLQSLSRERIGHEMRRLLGAADPAPSVSAMEHAGVLRQVLPGATSTALPVLVHMEDGCDPQWLRRLIVLGGADPSTLWRLTKAETRDIGRLHAAIDSAASAAELGYRLGARLAADAVLARAAATGSTPPEGWEADIARGAAAKFPVRPADLMPDLQGPDLGARLKALEARWIESDFTLTRAELLA